MTDISSIAKEDRWQISHELHIVSELAGTHFGSQGNVTVG